MDLTTLARVKKIIQTSSTESDLEDWFNQVIPEFSVAVEKYLERVALAGTQVEKFFPYARQTAFDVRGVPITSLTSVADSEGNTYNDATDSYLDEDAGQVIMRVFVLEGVPLTITYVGGMAANTTAFITAFPDIADAVDLQLAAFYQRRDELAGRALSDSGGSVSFEQPTIWLPHVRMVLDRHKLYI